MPMFGPTSDHGEIRQWAAVNGAVPVEVKTILFDGEPTKLAFMFVKGQKIEQEFKPITWEGFFAIFDLMGLSFVYDDARPSSYELLEGDGAERTGFGVGPS